MGTTKKNEVLLHIADALIKEQNYILGKNAKDVEIAKENGMEPGMVDRLMLTKDRIAGMAEGIRQVAALPDPVGEVTSMKQRPNGLMIGWKKVPLGVIGMIYESRPNVTADAFSLCFKAGNVVILRGGSDAFLSNCAITKVIRTALAEMDIPEDAVQLIRRYQPRNSQGIYAAEPVCGCTDSQRRSWTDPQCGREQPDTGDRDWHRQLPYFRR